jgi:hypothetical protein
MGKTILGDMWLCQRSDGHCHCLRHSPLFARLPNPSQRVTGVTVVPNGKTKLDLGSSTDSQLTLLTSSSFSTLATQPTRSTTPLTKSPAIRKQHLASTLVNRQPTDFADFLLLLYSRHPTYKKYNSPHKITRHSQTTSCFSSSNNMYFKLPHLSLINNPGGAALLVLM